EIRDHFSRFAPFDELPEDVLDELSSHAQVRYFKAGSSILERDEAITDLHYIRSGAVEIYRRSGELYNRLGEGDIFGQASLRRGGRVRFPARALEDTLIYFIPGELFTRLCEQHDSLADFVDTEGAKRLRSAAQPHGRASELVRVRVNKLISRPPVMLDAQASIHRAAAVMTEQSVSALLLTQPDPLQSMMTPAPLTLQTSTSVLDATLSKLRHKIRHLPTLSRARPVGLITLADVIRSQSQSSLNLVNGIYIRSTVSELQSLGTAVR